VGTALSDSSLMFPSEFMFPFMTLKDSRPFGMAIIHTMTLPPLHCLFIRYFGDDIYTYDLQSSGPSKENRFSSEKNVTSQLWYDEIHDLIHCMCLAVKWISYCKQNQLSLGTFVPYFLIHLNHILQLIS